MLTLAIDTATKVCTIALCCDKIIRITEGRAQEVG